jgi:tRNA(fMet)-specific endonuclease VapC
VSGEIALDTSVAIRFLNGDAAITGRVLALPEIVLPTVVVGALLFGAENSTRLLQNLPRYLEIHTPTNFSPSASRLIKPTKPSDRRK